MRAYIGPRRLRLCALLLMVLFIFTQSLLPPSLSSAESEAVGGFLSILLPEDTPLGAFVHANLRKLAHFGEFGLLGVLTILFLAPSFSGTSVVSGMLFGLCTAITDETIQVFSGRGPAVLDVWIDFFGFLSLGAIALLIAHLWIKRKNRTKL